MGTDISPLADVPKAHLLVVTPDVKVSTAEAYKALNAPALTKAESAVILHVSRTEAQIADSVCKVMHNDFEPVIFRLESEVQRARDKLLEAGADCALLAGSGSSVFGVFKSRELLERAAESLRNETRWQVFLCGTQSRAEYLKALGNCAALL